MEDEIKKEVVTEESEEETQEQEDSSVHDEQKEDGGEEKESVDYKAELERVKAQLTKAEYKLDKVRREKKSSNEGGEEKINPDDIAEKIISESRKEIEKFKQDFVADTIEEELSSLSANEDERELIKFYYENRIAKSGFNKSSIHNDLLDAKLIANRSKYEKTIKELKASADAKDAKEKKSIQSERTDDGEDIKLSEKEKRMAQIYGLTPKQIRYGFNSK